MHSAGSPQSPRHNDIGDAGAEVLPQCAALAHLDLSYNWIGAPGAECLAGVLAQGRALAHLDLRGNGIEADAAERLRASWRGQASGLFI